MMDDVNTEPRFFARSNSLSKWPITSTMAVVAIAFLCAVFGKDYSANAKDLPQIGTVRRSDGGTFPAARCSAEALGAWTPMSQETAPSPRFQHTAVWTGHEMLVWGGAGRPEPSSSSSPVFADGGRYDPVTDTWRPITTERAPSSRQIHTSVWTGTEMIVWGGQGPGATDLADGGRYDPTTNTWRPLSNDGAPILQAGHRAVWTGTEMVVWGRSIEGVRLQPSGGRYNPASDTWAPLSSSPADVPYGGHTVVWTGHEVILWGGGIAGFPSPSVGTGARWDPRTDAWASITRDGAPSRRSGHKAVWTGREMIVWGGMPLPGSGAGGVEDAAAYDPVTDTWKPLSPHGAPSPRNGGSAVWTGQEFVIWSGILTRGGRLFPLFPEDAAAYDPNTQAWRPLPAAPLELRSQQSTVWTGSEVLIFGGSRIGPGAIHFNDGARYSPPCKE
jgi:N-acetylneuraminic acid mutarotase